MANFMFENGTRIYWGTGVEEEAGKLCREFALTDTVMTVSYAEGPLRPLVERVIGYLKAEGLKVVEYNDVVPNPLLDKTREAIQTAKEQGVGMTLGIGGGSCIDVAKAIALGTRLEKDIWEVYSGAAEPDEILPVGAIMTLAGTGSETSPFAVLTNTEEVSKIGYGCTEMRPRFALLNPELTFGVPAYQTMCGACDIFAHICDAYLGRIEDMKLTSRLSESVMKTVIEYLPAALEKSDDYEARSQLMLCGTLAMGKFASMGLYTNLGLHTIAEDLGAVYNVTHGAALSVILPAWMTYLKKEKFNLLLRYAREVWNLDINADHPEKTVDAAIRKTKEFFAGVGLPVTLSELGIDFEKDGKMLSERINCTEDYGDAYIALTPEDVYEIYRFASK